MPHRKPRVGRDLIPIEEVAHEFQRDPMFVRELEVFGARRPARPFLVPIEGIDEIAFGVGGWDGQIFLPEAPVQHTSLRSWLDVEDKIL